MHLKPDIQTATKIIRRDDFIKMVLCIAVILLAVAAFSLHWNYQPVFAVAAAVAFLMMGSKPDIPDASWSPQQKAAWTKRYTTLKLKENKLVYVAGETPSDVITYALKGFDRIAYEKKRLLLIKENKVKHKINAEYWSPQEVQSFVSYVNDRIKEHE